MKFLAVIADNWFTLLQSIGIIGSLLLGTISRRDDVSSRRESTRIKRAQTFLSIDSEHRRLWREHRRDPLLRRSLMVSVDLETEPVTPAERQFVHSVILHTNATFQANRLGALIPPEKLRDDVRQFFSLPIPAAVYAEHKSLLDQGFVDYIDEALS